MTQGGGAAASPGWSALDVDRLCLGLGAFFDLHDPQFLLQVRFAMGKRLGEGNGPFPVAVLADPRSQIMALVQSMDRSRDPERALRALADTLRFLRGDEAAMVTLDELVEELAPAGRLPGSRLRAVISDLHTMKATVPLSAASDALERALLPNEPSGLRGGETVPVIVRRLNDVRENGAGGEVGARGPLVLRFLAELAAALPEEAATLLYSHVVLAVHELGLPPQVRSALIGRATSMPGPAAGRRLLQIRLSETAPGQQKYEVDGTLFDWTDTGLRRPRKREAAQPYS
ncbi:effector-associated domain 2-containing protein, partial [Lysinibacillus sp. NPDC056185]|uniref:effector-associated domain 2-containing protein n=1 Tax=Lysinibacillus sp. NPDC056185 TaxID=3345739 RepID=UPI0039F1467F